MSAVAVGQELLNVPFPEMVANLALAIAQGQRALDEGSIQTFKELAEPLAEPIKITGPGGAVEYSGPAIGLGILPTFYQFSHAVIEVKMAISMVVTRTTSIEARAGLRFRVFSASVNAKYQNTYSYKVEGSSLLRAEITPVPPPQPLLDLVKAALTPPS